VIRVLLADDQAIVRTGLRTLLGAEPDIEIVGEAADGNEVLAALHQTRPDVVLMDIRMPGLDGIAATAEIVHEGSDTRVCILTTYGLDEYVYDALAAGASGFLLKTDSPDRIVTTLRAIAAGEFALGTQTTQRLVMRYLQGVRPSASSTDVLASLTSRERDVFAALADGLSNAEIADRLFVGEGTVKTHVARILMKLDLRDRVQVVVFAYGHGLVANGHGVVGSS
jgi:DNA-binding NarL/FixJ family response regulator